MIKDYVTKAKISQIPNEAFTHGGVFHADDVFSAALLKYLNPDIKITRGPVSRIPENYEGIVFDIGAKNGYPEFDHHGEQEYRPKEKSAIEFTDKKHGTPYAALGKLWREFGGLVFSKPEQVEAFDKSFVQNIDYSDCTGVKNPLSTAISSFVPCWDEPQLYNEAFEEALGFAQKILVNEINQAKALDRAHELLTEAYKNAENGILILPQFAPWQNFVKDKPEIKFAIFPGRDDEFSIQGAQKSPPETPLRMSFPKEWLGKPAEFLQQQVEGLTFCHASNFLASAKTIEAAIATVEKIYELQKEIENPNHDNNEPR